MRSSFRIGRVAGIDIGVHYTWLLALILISWSLAQGFFPQIAPGLSMGTYWIAGVIGALLLFVSVLLHELAHSIVANARGLRVHSITLFIFGGVSNIEGEPERPQVELVMSIVGPLTSLVLAGIFYGFYMALGTSYRGGALSAVLYYLAYVNGLLAVFNILPGLPLDGGRVLRSIIWAATGSLSKATNIASTTGRIIGWLLIALGVFQLFSGNFLGGLWIAFIGWFLSSAAESSRREVSLQEQLGGVRVGDVMEPMPECVDSHVTVRELVWLNFIQHNRRAVPICYDGKIQGIVTLTDVKRLPQEKWDDTTIESIMTRSPLYTVSKDDDLAVALKLLAQHGLNQVPVLSEGRLVGLLSRADIIRYLQISQELGILRPKPVSR
ncbi:MAG: site-2 protease family protein [Dehalococcoidia bacterium]|nr:site-2 protease family protein [Dehalococcoidia bacterium]